MHFNSIYEVPGNPYSKSVPWMKEGNIVVNGVRHGILFLSPDLSRVLKHVDYSEYSARNSLHDVQVTPEGELIMFNNWTNTPGKIHSSIEAYDPVKKVRTILFEASPVEMFFSPACGGVQKVGDLIFFSHITNGGYLWSPKEKKLLWFYPGTKGDLLGLEVTQQLKLLDPEKFLKNHRN